MQTRPKQTRASLTPARPGCHQSTHSTEAPGGGRCLLQSCGLQIDLRFLRDPILWACLITGIGLAIAAGTIWPPLFPATPVSAIAALGLVIWQPLIEEIVFRGIAQNALLEMTHYRHWGSITLGNAIQATAFGFAHRFHHAWPWALAMVPVGLLFGYLRERQQHIGGSFLTHALWNFAYFWLIPLLVGAR